MENLDKYPFLKPFFWSYHLKDLNMNTHKNLIIKQILNHGSMESVVWLRNNYSVEDITTVIENSMKSEWSKKSLHLWELMYHIKPKRNTRFA